MHQAKPRAAGAARSEVPTGNAGRELAALLQQLLDRLELTLQDPRLHPDQRSDLEDVRRLVRRIRQVMQRNRPSGGGGCTPDVV